MKRYTILLLLTSLLWLTGSNITGLANAPNSGPDVHLSQYNQSIATYGVVEKPPGFISYSTEGSFVSRDQLTLLTNSFDMSNGGGSFDSKSVFSYNFMAPANAEYNNLQQEASQSGEVLFRQGMYYGFTFMVILLNLVCFFLFDEKVFLYYFLSLTALTSVFLFSDGLLTLFGMENFANARGLQSTLLMLAIGCAAVFSHNFLSLQDFYPKLKWVSMVQYGTAGLLILACWVSGQEIFANLANVILFGIMATYFFTGVLLFGRKNYAKFYVIAYAIPLLFAVDYFVLRNLGIDFLFTQSSHVKAAALVEMLVLSYAIVYRMQAIKEENLLRQTEMRIFLRQQEALSSRQKTEKLIEDVYLENLIMHYDLDGLEIKLLQYISEGKDNTKIARKLKTTEADVEELTKELYHKLEISEHIKEDFRMVESQPDYIYN
ncbi:7TM diverse intracellular signaling domain-containing protein [Aureitalea marina]|uniref:7TM-DISM receptor extracellular domain-containing protein n=1 Tax=Aureitalea marina TaxID=930804 RepID=A0A2S7KPL1_9FLAO|nr:7TM diverse intracellular signaling domain-containing protein [Aureitalea marina]PQB04518.1 hypothetical protein BST85_06095 [Aureitalea marina]